MSQGYRRPRLSTGAYMGSRAVSYVLPWLVSFLAMPVALLVYFLVRPSGAWVAITTLAFASLVFATWRFWSVRRKETQFTATAFALAVLGWVLFAGVTCPWAVNSLRSWALGGFTGSLAWCIRHAALGGVTEHDGRKDAADGGRLQRLVGALKGAQMGQPKATDNEVRVPVTLDAPTTSGDLQRTKDQIAAVSGVSASQVSVLKDPDNEAKATVVFSRKIDASRPVAYKGPSAPGQSIAAAPVHIGGRVNGTDMGWWISGDSNPDSPRPVGHTKCTGVTGAGKTETICTAILDMRWRTDIVPVVADPAKFRQSFGDIEEALGLAAKTPDEARQLIRNLPAVVEYRSDLLGSLQRADGGTGYKQWEPECYTLHGVPFLFIDVEEAADVAMDMMEELDEAVRKLRSLGVHLCLSMQTMPHDNISRKTRAQFTQSLAHGQTEYQDAKYALSVGTLEAGADPTEFGNTTPGALYAELLGEDKNNWPVKGRAVYMNAATKRMSIEGSRQFWAEMDQGTYERLAFGIDPAVTPAGDDGDEYDDEEFYEQAEGGLPAPTLEEMTGVDPNEPLPAPPAAALDISFSDAPPEHREMGTEEARRRLQNRLDVLLASGQRLVKFSDLADLPDEVGRSRGWVYENLGLLVKAGVLKEFRPPEGGVVYEIVKRYPQAG